MFFLSFREKTHGPGPEPSGVSMKSTQSMAPPIVFKEGRLSVHPRSGPYNPDNSVLYSGTVHSTDMV